MIDFFVWCLFVLAVAICALSLACWKAGIEYDKWQKEMDEKGIQTALEPIFHGNEVVGYTFVQERRSNRL